MEQQPPQRRRRPGRRHSRHCRHHPPWTPLPSPSSCCRSSTSSPPSLRTCWILQATRTASLGSAKVANLLGGGGRLRHAEALRVLTSWGLAQRGVDGPHASRWRRQAVGRSCDGGAALVGCRDVPVTAMRCHGRAMTVVADADGTRKGGGGRTRWAVRMRAHGQAGPLGVARTRWGRVVCRDRRNGRAVRCRRPRIRTDAHVACVRGRSMGAALGCGRSGRSPRRRRPWH